MLPAQPAPGLTAGLVPLAPERSGEPLGIVAGGGLLPLLVAHAAVDAGWRPVVVAIADGRLTDWANFDAQAFAWRRTGDIFAHLARRKVRHIVMCGTVSVRPDYRSLVASWRTLKLLPEIFTIVRGGDDNLLRAVAGALDRRGLTLHAVHEIAPELLMPDGVLTRTAPSACDRRALARAAAASEALGRLDIGQAAVASAERVIAVEGIEGTREMVRRVADLRARGRLGRSERCVLFKGVKPQQDRRLDLPSIGVQTIEEAGEAGIVGIGLTAGASLLLDAGALVERADADGVFLVGLPPEGESA
jgi:UDP-2,3-diacylglucosamine hydrolase